MTNFGALYEFSDNWIGLFGNLRANYNLNKHDIVRSCVEGLDSREHLKQLSFVFQNCQKSSNTTRNDSIDVLEFFYIIKTL